MGRQAELVIKEMAKVRPLVHNDDVVCKRIIDCKYNQYILNNSDNIAIIDEALHTNGIKLVIAPTGSGKSFSLLSRAKEMVKQQDCKVILALPSRALTAQVARQKGICAMMAGDKVNPQAKIICTTYEKMFEVEDYILKQRAANSRQRIVVLLDEAHLMVTQHLLRNKSIRGMIRCIEHKLFDNVLLITATPKPLSLFRCDCIIDCQEVNKMPAIEKIEILEVDSISEYLKNLDYSKEFPFVRLNSKKKIEQLINEMPQNIVKITSEDKNSKAFRDIIDNSRIDCVTGDGLFCTSVIEAGVNVEDYDENKIVPMAVFEDGNSLSCDDIEQFLNRIRRKGCKYVKTARVILKKTKERESKVSLLDNKGNVFCEFQDVVMQKGDLMINDVSLMDTVPDGRYKLKFEIGYSVQYQNFIVSSEGPTDTSRYSKVDSMPILFQEIGFKSFINVFKSNLASIAKIQNQLQILVDAMQEQRIRKQQLEHLTDDEMVDIQLDDEKLIEVMTKGAIDSMGVLKDCLSYENGQVQLDKRILHMISYNQYQSQYFRNRDILKEELMERMNVPVEIMEEDTDWEQPAYNQNNIWEGLEPLRKAIICNDDYCDDIFGRGKGIYVNRAAHRMDIGTFRCQELLMELLKVLDKAGIPGGKALQILTSSKSKAKVTRYKNLYHMITYNKVLDKFTGNDIKEIPYYTKEDKLQAVAYCYLKQNGKSSYAVNDALVEEIIAYYKEMFPLGVKIPAERAVKMKLNQIFKKKDEKIIKCEVRLNEDDIFKLLETDYK